MSRTYKISGSFDSESLLFRSLIGNESLSSLYEFKLEFLSKDKNFDARSLIGKELTLTVDNSGKSRFLSGLVTQAKRVGQETTTERYFIFEAIVRPWLWLATKTNHYKIFQKKNIPQVIKETLEEYPFELEINTEESYREWGYCVQYDETDYEFVSRLMEHEGMYFWFEHSEGKHKLIISDSKNSHKPVEAFDSISFYDHGLGLDHTEEHFYEWQPKLSITPTKFSSVDYNLNKPDASLYVEKDSSLKNNHGVDLEFYHSIGDYTETSEGERYADINVEIFEAQSKKYHGTSNSPLLTVGSTISLEKHPNDSQNQKYLITSIDYDFSEASYATNENQKTYAITKVLMIPASTQYRHPKVTSIPFTYGPQTAVVMGPPGESIYTDEYGRVKVKFHWDSAQIEDGDSSCWVRVSSPWAGGGFGGMQIPRVNEEVIIDFLGGHPDRPVIVGRLYNADNMPPVELPANATVSGFHTRTKDGTSDQANSLLFEDALGQELLKMVAQKNMDYYVKNDSNHSVGGASATNIVGAHTWNYGGLLNKKVTGKATYQHDKGHTVEVSGHSKDTVHKRQKRAYKGPNTETTTGTESFTVTGEPAIHGYKTGVKQNITGVRKDSISLNRINSYEIDEDVTVGGETSVTVSGSGMQQTAQNVGMTVGDYKFSSVGPLLGINQNTKSEAGAMMTHISIMNNLDSTCEHKEKSDSLKIKITGFEDKMVLYYNDFTNFKFNFVIRDLSQQLLKAGVAGLNLKGVIKTNDKEDIAGNLIGIDFDEYKEEEHRALKVIL
ncbi:type VI secretion system Vgr family protein [Taylorella equigenitalis]|uniref:VgrG protein n=3 Tax=Taylorella equigenitalis TaxID=29575 RepID=A0A654KET6_TAYEM|nr:type VI secretion system tip protein TssI/VgrG [Taylorella equigenitalis]ADU90962.1 VgrG protein [Taylorella equigenitalis MCE9]AFN36069.1 Rhs element Vgr protein [Taylorella equigenitalis ATCC 35865]ASY30706.1 type VI secretion protein VgrG [Taylorella equigenitalis]ASY38005.1 type VI secretion system tip protein VgrG [Taylorella equigenitalis]ASY39483.1 type VI secretion protein VgrG [Taylorella equigenitalis]